VPLPKNRADTGNFVPDFKKQPLVDQVVKELGPGLRDLIRRAERVGPPAGGMIVLLTGCRPEAGCTTIAAALAAVGAANHSTLLVDGNLARPALAALAGLRPRFGWEEVIEGRCSIEQALHSLDPDEQVPCLLLKGPLSNAEYHLPGSPQQWLSELRESYNLIVVDGGSVWESGAAWAPWVDAALVVCDSGRTLADEWARAWDRLEEAGCHVLGIVETFV
jgi:Mrp family chromosome partitioning ATPase